MTAGLAWGAVPERAQPPSPLPSKAALAMAPFSAGSGVTLTEAAVMRNLVEAELIKTGRFIVLERSKLDFILQEKKLDYAGLSEERAAAELGRLTGAALAVFGSVSRDGKGYLVTVGLTDVVSAAVLRSETASAEEDYLFRQAARKLAAALAQ
jgi:TolB-like protein